MLIRFFKPWSPLACQPAVPAHILLRYSTFNHWTLRFSRDLVDPKSGVPGAIFASSISSVSYIKYDLASKLQMAPAIVSHRPMFLFIAATQCPVATIWIYEINSRVLYLNAPVLTCPISTTTSINHTNFRFRTADGLYSAYVCVWVFLQRNHECNIIFYSYNMTLSMIEFRFLFAKPTFVAYAFLGDVEG